LRSNLLTVLSGETGAQTGLGANI